MDVGSKKEMCVSSTKKGAAVPFGSDYGCRFLTVGPPFLCSENH